MAFPENRARRLRRSEGLRRLVRETRLSPDDLVQPLFVVPGRGVRNPVASMPGVDQTSVDELLKDVKGVAEVGVPAVILFGIPPHKDATGSDACSDDGIVQQAVRAAKDACPDLVVITDVCFCEYTDHGHCGWIEGGGRGGGPGGAGASADVDNDQTLEMLGLQALTHAKAGADVVAPSGMMDGAVGYIRDTLDEGGYEGLPILSYAVKYSSAFYGPFRDAAESAPAFGDRRTYQMDPANSMEALREAALDVEEGADMLMVKPALAYLDVIAKVREEFDLPVAAYNVSGEFSMVHAAARNGWIDAERITLEILTSIKRAGADFILTYSARDVARRLG